MSYSALYESFKTCIKKTANSQSSLILKNNLFKLNSKYKLLHFFYILILIYVCGGGGGGDYLISIISTARFIRKSESIADINVNLRYC